MGRVDADSGAVRYVSPVTARLFSKMGSEILGLSSGEVLAPMAGMSSREGGGGGGPAGDAGVWRAHPPPDQRSGGVPGEQTWETAQHQQQYTVGIGALERRVEVVRPYSTSPVNGVTCPHAYLESILRERVSGLV